jgi:translation elongation factor EF-4
MEYIPIKAEEYILNLIDTPGHVFSYKFLGRLQHEERSLIDAAQSIQAERFLICIFGFRK